MPLRRRTRAFRATRLTLVSLSVGAAFLAAPAIPANAEPPASQPAVDDGLPALFDPALHMRTADVEVGMTGYGLTVFQGSELTRFDVEVVGLLRNTQQIGTDVVLIHATGGPLETTGPIQGMSGSPIYLTGSDGRDRLIGAFAFGWPYSRKTIAGVQPIEAMLRLDEITTRAATPAPSRPVNLAAFANAIKHPDLAFLRTEKAKPLAAAAGLMPLEVPVQVRGSADAALQQVLADAPFTPVFVAGTSTGRSDARSVGPGMPLVVPVLTGDLELAVVGTATTTIGDKVFAFGHPLFDLGNVELPMAAGTVDATIPLQSMSFKLGTTGKVVGTLRADATSGVSGTLGPAPAMADLGLTVRRDGSEQTFKFQAAPHPLVVGSSVAAAVVQAVTLGGGFDTDGAARYTATLELETEDGPIAVSLGDVVPGSSGMNTLALTLRATLQALTDSPFGEATLTQVTCEVDALEPGARPIAAISAASVPRKVYAPGSIVPVAIELDLGGSKRAVTAQIELPIDLPEGRHTIQIISSGEALSNEMMATTLSAPPRSVAGLADVFSQAADYPNDSIYLRLERPDAAALSVDGAALPQLPPSVSKVLAGASRSDVTPVPSAAVVRTDVPYLVLDGSATVEIVVRQ